MEPVTFIAGALAAGAATGVQNSASDTVRDAYRSLCQRVRERLGGRSSELDSVLRDQHAVRDSGSAVLLPSLLKLLEDSKAGEAKDLLKLAAEVVHAAGGQSTAVFDDSPGSQNGNSNHQQNTFYGSP